MGLGHAIWCARAIVGDEPFAIFLPDELMVGKAGGTGCMKQMVEAYEEVGGNVISVLEVPMEEVSSYGVIDPGAVSGNLTASERPGGETGASRSAVKQNHFGTLYPATRGHAHTRNTRHRRWR